MNFKARVITVAMTLMLILTACQSKEMIGYSDETFVLGTYVSIQIYSTDTVPNEVFDRIFERLSEIEYKMTINQDVDSEIQLINQDAGVTAVTVSDDTYEVVKAGAYYSQITDGRFDITIGPLVKLWNIGFDEADVPEEKSIQDAVELIGYDGVELLDNNQIMLNQSGMMIDLGGIAKGYAADEAARIIQDEGYESAIINLGGNIFCLGEKQDGSSFKVGIRDPYGSQSDYVGVVSIKNKTVVSSGIYEKYFEKDGVTYHHIFDVEKGYPVDNNLMSVTIICDSSLEADALSTSVFALGLTEGMSFVEDYEDVEAIFITKDDEIYISSGLEGNFSVANESFTLK